MKDEKTKKSTQLNPLFKRFMPPRFKEISNNFFIV